MGEFLPTLFGHIKGIVWRFVKFRWPWPIFQVHITTWTVEFKPKSACMHVIFVTSPLCLILERIISTPKQNWAWVFPEFVMRLLYTLSFAHRQFNWMQSVLSSLFKGRIKTIITFLTTLFTTRFCTDEVIKSALQNVYSFAIDYR